MSSSRDIAIIGIGMVSAVGLRAPGTAAAVRAGLAGLRTSAIPDRRLNPIVVATVPDPDLPPLAPSLQPARGRSTRRLRMLQLAGAALRESLEGSPRIAQVPVLLALPAAHGSHPPPYGPDFLDQLAVQADVAVHLGRSRVFAQGRAAGFIALCEAIERLRAGAEGYVVVGGVDSYLDFRLLSGLDVERRIRATGVVDGFSPGEGAAFLLLTSAANAHRIGRPELAIVHGSATAEEPGHRYSEQVYRGDGLDLSLRRLFAALGEQPAPVQTVYAGFNGESFNAKEWGVAYIRHKERFAEPLAIEHPADCLGDTGAALGPMLLGLAAIGLSRGYRRSPCLVWCPSDRAERGAALLGRAPGEVKGTE